MSEQPSNERIAEIQERAERLWQSGRNNLAGTDLMLCELRAAYEALVEHQCECGWCDHKDNYLNAVKRAEAAEELAQARLSIIRGTEEMIRSHAGRATAALKERDGYRQLYDVASNERTAAEATCVRLRAELDKIGAFAADGVMWAVVELDKWNKLSRQRDQLRADNARLNSELNGYKFRAIPSEPIGGEALAKRKVEIDKEGGLDVRQINELSERVSRFLDWVWIDVNRMFGVPCVRGTRVPCEAVYNLWLAEGDVSKVANSYAIDIVHALAAIAFHAQALAGAQDAESEVLVYATLTPQIGQMVEVDYGYISPLSAKFEGRMFSYSQPVHVIVRAVPEGASK